MMFNYKNTLLLCAIYGKLKIKPKSLDEVMHYNTMLALGLIELENNSFFITEKGLKYLKEST